MPVFDQTGVTTLANQDPGTDHSLPASGLLAYAGINTSTALSDTDGQDCKVVTGKRDQKITSDMRERIFGNLDSTISQNETHTVQQNKTETVIGLYTLTVTGGWQETQYGPVNRHYLVVVTDTFSDDHQQTVPDSSSFTHARYANTYTKDTLMSIVGAFQLNLTIGICLTLATLIDLEFKSIHAELHLIHIAGNAIEMTWKEFGVKLAAVEAAIGSALNAWASANSGLDYDVGMPFS